MFSWRNINLLCIMLVVIGGVNWGLVALFGYDPLGGLLGGYSSPVTRILYGIIGIAAIVVFNGYLMTPGENHIGKNKIR